MVGESRASKRRIKDRIDKHGPATSSGDDETRLYAKHILAKVRKLEVELVTLSMKCSEPTSGEMEVVDLEAEEEGHEDPGEGNQERGHKHKRGDDLSRFKKEMKGGFKRVNGEMVSLRKLVESLNEHVSEPGSKSKSSTPAPSPPSSSLPEEFSANVLAAASEDDSKSEPGSLNVDSNAASSGGLSKRTKAKKVKVGSGRSEPGSPSSNFGSDGDDVEEEQQELTEAMHSTGADKDQKRTGASKERMNNKKTSCAVTREQEAGKKTRQLTRTPAVPKVTPRPGPSTQSLLSDQSIPANQLGTRNASHSRGPKNRLLRKKGTGNKLDCVFCQRKFKDKSHLEVHILSHIGERPQFCNLCPYESSSRTALKRHLETHKSDRERKFQCDLCPKRFFFKKNVQRHMKECHTVPKEFKCEVCNMCFRRKANLTMHIRGVHEKKRPFQCEDCPKTFTVKSKLKTHMLVHTGEKNHCCGICDKKFSQKNTLDNHMRSHTGDRPFNCPVCGKSFRSVSSRCRHERRHQK